MASSLDYWRKVFRSSNSDIFQVIENAIEVAACDRPDEFFSYRDRIAEKLFTSQLHRCGGCDRIREPADQDREDGEEDEDEELYLPQKEDVRESKIDSTNGGGEPVSNYSYDVAEALTEEIEEEIQNIGEVDRIKAILSNHRDESDGVLFESLRRLELMALSVETLKRTEIGREVNRLRKHNSKHICSLARILIDGWKVLVDEWVNTAPAVPDNVIADNATPDSVNPSVLDEEEGLPSPPLDEGALFATQPIGMQLSEFFDGMDDDGNLRNDGEFEQNRDSGRRFSDNQKPVRKQHSPYIPEPVQPNRDSGRRFSDNQKPVRRQHSPYIPEPVQPRRQEQVFLQIKSPNGQSKPQGTMKSKVSTTDSGPGRPARLAPEQQKGSSYMNSGIQKKGNIAPHDRTKNSEDSSVRAKLEVAKRKLQECYQQAENAKKQRTIQVMELRDLPKQGHHHNTHRQPNNVKQKSNIRNWASARR